MRAQALMGILAAGALDCSKLKKTCLNILMSYFLQVLQAIKELLPSDPVVCRCVIDFELAIWSAVRPVFADVEIMACVFHWSQGLRRKIITSYRTCNICICI